MGPGLDQLAPDLVEAAVVVSFDPGSSAVAEARTAKSRGNGLDSPGLENSYNHNRKQTDPKLLPILINGCRGSHLSQWFGKSSDLPRI